MEYLIYQIENKVNGKIYIGAHKTEDANDSYMGSGVALRSAIGKYGKDSFVKTILHTCTTEEDMYIKESELVTEEFVKKTTNYNMKVGGFGGWTSKGKSHFVDEDGTVTWKYVDDSSELDHIFKGKVLTVDKNGNREHVSVDDPRYVSGELKHYLKGTTSVIDDEGNVKRVTNEEFAMGEYRGLMSGRLTVKDEDGNTMSVYKDDVRYESGELVSAAIGKIVVKDEDGNTMSVSVDDDRYVSGELKHVSTGRVTVRDYSGKTFSVVKDDSRYLSGELVGVTKGHKASEETKVKMSDSAKGKKIAIDKDGNKFRTSVDDPRFVTGEIKSVVAGMQWINNTHGKSRRIPEGELIPEGWVKGRAKFTRKKNK